jgi:hypothetical protein
VCGFLALLLLSVWVVCCVCCWFWFGFWWVCHGWFGVLFLMELDCRFLNGILQDRISVVVLFPAEVANGDVTEESDVSGHYEKRYD